MSQRFSSKLPRRKVECWELWLRCFRELKLPARTETSSSGRSWPLTTHWKKLWLLSMKALFSPTRQPCSASRAIATLNWPLAAKHDFSPSSVSFSRIEPTTLCWSVQHAERSATIGIMNWANHLLLRQDFGLVLFKLEMLAPVLDQIKYQVELGAG